MPLAVSTPSIGESPEFPDSGSDGAKLKYLLRYAMLAPSAYNTQPWAFQIRGNAVALFGDAERAMPVADPDGRELIMSCGAALFHLRLGIEHHGYTPLIETFPDRDRPDLLAMVRLGPPRGASVSESLFSAIPNRHTNRGPFEPCPVPLRLLFRLQLAAAQEGAELRLVKTDELRSEVARLIGEADRRLSSNDAYRAELSKWIRSNAAPGDDGVPAYAFGLRNLTAMILPHLNGEFDLRGALARSDEALALNAPALAVLQTSSDDRLAWLESGQALARVLLLGSSEDLQASFFSQPQQVPALRNELASLLGRRGYPQLVVRFGYGDAAAAIRRRSVEDCLEGEQG